MEHRDAHALLELAAVEPEGFARLAAGDTAESAALAGHLAGCPACAAEFEHLGRLAGVLRSAVRSLPPPDLRERTLAVVVATGRDRSTAASLELSADPVSTVATIAAPSPRPAKARRPVHAWGLATAAAIMVAVVGFGGWWTARSDLEHEQAASTLFAAAAEGAVRVAAQPDALTVELEAPAPGGATAKGEVVVSPASQEIVVLAEGLPEPAAGLAYRCWVETDGVREAIGTMTVHAGLATWVGWSAALERLRPGSRLGVSLARLDGEAPGEVVLAGDR